MDITRRSFDYALPILLNAIAGAHFVAIDLEFSGIPGRQLGRLKGADDGAGGKQSLQRRYEETKRAAETYQVLQMGITCVAEDKDTGVYTARPYNFFLNPVPDQRMDLERVFSYQSGAVDFLLSHGFRMEAPFIEGVNYMSREEEEAERKNSLARDDLKTSIPDIQIKADDKEALEFVRRVRYEIDVWLHHTNPKPEYLIVSTVNHGLPPYTDKGLNGFQKRLVHQLIRAEHPDLVTVSRQGFIQIVPFDQEREDALRVTRTKYVEERLTRQIGIRWAIEAMARGSLDSVDPVTFGRTGDPTATLTGPKAAERQFAELRARLKQKRTILVGHNLFIDIMYFYQSFFGTLPDRVEDFQDTIHKLFPMIIDTKYLATHNNNEKLARSSLEELDFELRQDADIHQLPQPAIVTHPNHDKYNLVQPAHEAGFDSLLTAKILIRLAAKLEAAGQYIDICESDDAYHTASEDIGDVTGGVHLPSNVEHSISDSSSEGVPLVSNKEQISPSAASKKNQKKKAKKKLKQAVKEKTPFSHEGMFDVLGQEDADVNEIGVLQTGVTSLEIETKDHDTPPPRKILKMPPWDSDFWNTYGNKLRVNGTVEGVCKLAGEEAVGE